MNRWLCILSCFFAWAVLQSTSLAQQSFILEDVSFEDFSHGKLSNAGRNLFIRQDGSIEFIHWFDLNNDGYPEVTIVNDHNHYETVPGMIYYNTVDGFHPLFHPRAVDAPKFQGLEWSLNSMQHMDWLPSLGGGKAYAADFNGDGFIDIAFCNFVHGWSYDHYPVLIYWGAANGFSKDRRSVVPTLGGAAITAGDFTGNGKQDLVIANMGREYVIRVASRKTAAERQQDGIERDEAVSFIYPYGLNGYDFDERIELPTEYAIDVVGIDLNLDGYLDLVFLQAGKEGSVRIFYGSEKGIDPEQYTDIRVLAPTWHPIPRSLHIADLNGDGWPDIFVPSADEHSEILWNRKGEFSTDDISLIETKNAGGAASADLNNDGYVDLVIANTRERIDEKRSTTETDSYVYWGGPDGFSSERRLHLPTLGATAVEIADVTGSGTLDILFANHRSASSFDVSSYIYRGDGGYDPADRIELDGFSAADIVVADFNRDGRKDVFLSNRQSGRSGVVDMYIYWGNPKARYSTASMTALPGPSPETIVTTADITGNGYADLIYVQERGELLTIIKGDADGYIAERRLERSIPFRAKSVEVADFNRDGYLDVVVGSIDSENVAVYHGSESGLGEAKVITHGIPHYTSSVGDLDGDGYLDIVYAGMGEIRILYGDEGGDFSEGRILSLPVERFTTKINLADLNGDGMLDIIAYHFSTLDTGDNNIDSAIYWNRDGVFDVSDRSLFATHGAHQGSIADVDGDGHLDIVAANYHGRHGRSVDSYIYLGDGSESFSQERRKGLPAYSSSGNYVIDLNGDGYMDIVVFNHSESTQYIGLAGPRGGVHGTGSYIYWGGESGWSMENRSWIPSFGPHNRLNNDLGDVARRLSYETYQSAPREMDGDVTELTLEISGVWNEKQSIRGYIRRANSPEALELAQWTQLPPLETEQEGVLLLHGEAGSKGQWIQYQLELDSNGTGSGPRVNRVRLW